MDFETLKTKPVKLITENNILDDVVYLNDSIEVLFNKLEEKVHKDFRDFLIVILNSKEKNEVQFVITSKEFSIFINSLNSFLSSSKPPKFKSEVSELDLQQFRTQDGVNMVQESVEIQRALDVIKSSNLEVLVVVNSEKKYIGKIKRSSLRKNLVELID